MAFEEFEGNFTAAFDPFRSQDHDFLFNSRSLSQKNETLAAEVGANLNGLPWLPERNLDILIMDRESSPVHAEAKCGYDVISLKDGVLERQAEPICKAILSHERTHLQIGSEITHHFTQNFPEIDDFFHRRLLPDWRNGALDLAPDLDFCVSDKGWEDLLPNGLYSESLADFQAAIATYFSLVRKNLIKIRNGKIAYLPSPAFASFQQELAKAPGQPLDGRYQADPAVTATQIVTGLEVAEIFTRRYRNALERSYQTSLFELEEGFANFIGCEVANQDLDQLNQYFPQDAGKISLARKTIQAAKDQGIAPAAALAQVRSYPELFQFYKTLGLI